MTTALQTTPADLGFDPERYPHWRQGQWAIIEQILDWYRHSSARFMFLEAPTGVGKSLIAGAVAKALEQSDEAQWVTISTTTLNLQRQYMEDTLNGLALSAWGRSNHECLVLPPGNTVADGPCTHGYKCPVRVNCSYYAERDAAAEAPLVVLNTAFYLTCANRAKAYEDDARGGPNLFNNSDLTIVDEAHLLDGAIRSMAEIRLNRQFFSTLGFPLPNVSEYGQWDAWLNSTIPVVDPIAKAYSAAAKEAAKLGQKPEDSFGQQAVNQHQYMVQLAGEILPTKPLIEHTQSSTIFRPIWSRDFAQGLLFRHAEKFLLMSATIIHPKYLAETLGIPESDYRYVQMPSPFAPMKRRIIYQPVRKVTGKTTPAEFGEVVAAMDTMITRSHTEQKGIIHSVSYARAKQIVAESLHADRMITHTQERGSKERAIAQFVAAPAGAILISPSVGVGEDFGKGDNCRFQFFLKYPIPYLGDPVTKARSEENPESLWNEADMAFVQAYGRGMRSEDDFCTSYVLDSAAGRRFRHLPRWVQDAVVDRSSPARA